MPRPPSRASWKPCAPRSPSLHVSPTTLMSKPRVWYIPPESHTRTVFRPEVFVALRERYDLRATEGQGRVTAEEVTRQAPEFEAIVTGWGSPAFPDEALRRAERLRMVAHSAGSVK